MQKKNCEKREMAPMHRSFKQPLVAVEANNSDVYRKKSKVFKKRSKFRNFQTCENNKILCKDLGETAYARAPSRVQFIH